MSYGNVCFCGHYDIQHNGACAFEWKGAKCSCTSFDKAPEWDYEAFVMLEEGKPIQKCSIHGLWFLTQCRKCHLEEYMKQIN